MKKEFLIIDNYDSFTYNVQHALYKVRPEYSFKIIRNSSKDILFDSYSGYIISPGPKTPKETGLLSQVFNSIILPQKKPILGICLGMQFIAYTQNVKITKAKNPVHGETEEILHLQNDIFTNIPNSFNAARYNSLEVKMKDVSYNTSLKVLATDTNKQTVMALRMNNYPIVGVQFHPE
ncbi:MAG: aminodeoxychorismate/anthranilate synthase component II, partial [Candidatus Atribacteria bacterium]|nr:aminodeoxychorismate/anthranilate synthase component II [Candidatus Atribacteria bacterium]